MFGTNAKQSSGSWDESRESGEDDESWDETQAEDEKVEPFSIFGFKLFESEATLQVDPSKESDDNDSTVNEEEEQRRRGFFQRLWEGPTDKTDGDSRDGAEDSDSDEDEEPNVPPKHVGVALQRAPHPFTKPFENKTDRSIASTMSKNLSPVSPVDQSLSKETESKATAKSKRRFWNIILSKSNAERSIRNEGQNEPGRLNWPGRIPSRREPTSDLLKRVAAEQSMFSDRRDDEGDAHPRMLTAHERFTYEPEESGREEQELLKRFPSMNLGGGSITRGSNSDTVSRTASLRRSFLSPHRGNNYGDTLLDPPSKRCFPMWPSPVHSFEVPSDLTNSTDGIEASEYSTRRRGKAKDQQSISPYADHAPRSTSRGMSNRLPPKQVSASSVHKKRQLNELLSKYQDDRARHDHNHHEPAALRKQITLPPRSKTKSKSKSSKHPYIDQKNNRNNGSWDEHSGWFTLDSLDVM